MELFNADKGLIHFTFANTDDIYVKDSLAVLNLQQNLYYELKKSKYNSIFFFSLTNEDYTITCYNRLAIELAEEVYKKYIDSDDKLGEEEQVEEGKKKKSWFFWGKKNVVESEAEKTEDESNNGPSETSQESVCAKVFHISRKEMEKMFLFFESLIEQSGNTAFVFDIEVMESFRGQEEPVEIIKRNLKNYKKNNLLLVVSDTHIDASFDTLTHINGIFRTEAFPEINDACERLMNVRIYEQMRMKMADRVSYLNNMTRNEIYNLMVLAIFRNNLISRINRIEEYVDFVYMMVHSVEFSSTASRKNEQLIGLFSKIKKRRFSELYQILSEQKVYECMDSVLEHIKEIDLKNRVIKWNDKTQVIMDAEEKYQQYIFQNNSILRDLNHLSIFSGDWEDIDDKKKSEIGSIVELLNKVREELTKPYLCYNKDDHMALVDFISRCVFQMELAERNRDIATMKVCAEALYYAVCVCENECVKIKSGSGQQPGQSVCLEYYGDVWKLQSNLFEQQSQFQNYQKKVRELVEELAAIDRRVQEMRKRYPDIETRAKNGVQSSIVLQYTNLCASAKTKGREIESCRSLTAEISINIDAQENMIIAIKNTIASIQNGGISISDDIQFKVEEMEKNIRRMQELRERNRRYEEQVRDVMKTANVTGIDLDDDYDQDIQELLNI